MSSYYLFIACHITMRTTPILHLLILLTLSFSKVAALTNRIVGGKLANITSYPYQLSLRYSSNHICGASLLTSTLAISSAHCFPRPGSYSVKGGVTNLQEAGQVSHVKVAMIHPSYDTLSNDYDVALLLLATPLTLNKKLQPIKLPDSPARIGRMGVVSGWGTTQYKSKQLMSMDLRAVEIPILEWRQCKKLYDNAFTKKMLCAGWMEGGKDACTGDSGGPLMEGGVLRGIVSSGVNCAEKGFPGIYTDVYAMRGFIKEYGGL